MIIHGLDTLQLTQEKEKSLVDQCSTGRLKKYFLECETNFIPSTIDVGVKIFRQNTSPSRLISLSLLKFCKK